MQDVGTHWFQPGVPGTMARGLQLTALLLISALLYSLGADDTKQVRRFVNPRGWHFPGQEGIAGAKPTSTTNAALAGIAVEISVFSNLPIWNQREKRYVTVRVPFATGSQDSITITEQDLAADKVVRYSVANRPFLYTMLAYPCSRRPKGPGGCAGADIKLAYYDDDGDGLFEVMEVVNSIISPDSTQNWQPRVPAWAIDLGKSQGKCRYRKLALERLSPPTYR
jgi:hypothetical protein